MKIFTRPQGKWKYELNFLHMYGDGPKDPAKLAQDAAAEIRKLTAALTDEDLKMELDGVAEAFEQTVDSNATYNSCMDELYDVADRSAIWVKTF